MFLFHRVGYVFGCPGGYMKPLKKTAAPHGSSGTKHLEPRSQTRLRPDIAKGRVRQQISGTTKWELVAMNWKWKKYIWSHVLEDSKEKVKRFASKLGIQQTFSPHHPHPKINNRVEQKSSNLAALDSINITSACHRKHPASHHAASNHHLLDSPHLAQLLEVLLPSWCPIVASLGSR